MTSYKKYEMSYNTIPNIVTVCIVLVLPVIMASAPPVLPNTVVILHLVYTGANVEDMHTR